MLRFVIALIFMFCCWAPIEAQQLYKMPDVKAFKQLTSKIGTRGSDKVPMEFYSAPDGTVITVYTFRGRTIAFSTHKNSDVQKTYKLYLDNTGNGLFQEIPSGSQWVVPVWAK